MQNDYSQHQSKYTGQSIADHHYQPHDCSARQIGTIEEKEQARLLKEQQEAEEREKEEAEKQVDQTEQTEQA